MVKGFEVEANVQAEGTDTEKWAEFKGLCFTALTLLRPGNHPLTALIEAEYPNHHAEYVDFVKERLNAMSNKRNRYRKWTGCWRRVGGNVPAGDGNYSEVGSILEELRKEGMG